MSVPGMSDPSSPKSPKSPIPGRRARQVEEVKKVLLDAEEAATRFGIENLPTRRDGLITLALGHREAWKLLRYDIQGLVGKGGLRTILTTGTICTASRKITMKVIGYPILAGIAFWAAYAGLQLGYSADEVYAKDLVNEMFRLTPFLLGLYVGVSLSRWWAIRTKALGGIFNAVSNVNMLFCAFVAGSDHQESRNRIFRWSHAGMHLLVKATRNVDTFEDMIEDGYLTRQEADLIASAPVYQRGMVVWAWIQRAVREAQRNGYITGPVIGQFNVQCIGARNAMQTIHTYFDTQLPYAYVHLIAFMVALTNLATAMRCGVVLANAFTRAEQCGSNIDAGYVSKDSCSRKLDRILVINECLFVIVVPLVYDGLMAISYMIHDPFGPDMLDYPVKAYTACIVDNCYAFQHAAEQFPGCFEAPPGWQPPRPPGAPAPAPDPLSPTSEPTDPTGRPTRKTLGLRKTQAASPRNESYQYDMALQGDDDDGGDD